MSDTVTEYICSVCGLPSVRRSMGGPEICPSCDCGCFRNHRKWGLEDAHLVTGDDKQREEFRRRARVAAAPYVVEPSDVALCAAGNALQPKNALDPIISIPFDRLCHAIRAAYAEDFPAPALNESEQHALMVESIIESFKDILEPISKGDSDV